MSFIMNVPCERSRKDSEGSELSLSADSLPMPEESPMNTQDTDLAMSLDTPPPSPVSEDSELSGLVVPKLAKYFNIIHAVGCGYFGKVIEAVHKFDKERKAIKCILIKPTDDICEMWREAELLASLRHVNVVRYDDSWIDDYGIEDIPFANFNRINDDSYVRVGLPSNSSVTSSRVSSRSKLYLCIQMEFCTTDLAEVIKNELYKHPSRAWKIFFQMVAGLHYLHANNIIHGDLKPANVFVDGTDCVKIGDLGLATKTSCRSSDYTEMGDIYSLALIFSEMFGLTSMAIGKGQTCECGAVPQLEEKENVQQNCIHQNANTDPRVILRWLLNRETRPTCAQLLDYQKLHHQVPRDHILGDRNVNQYNPIHTDAFCNKISKTKSDNPFSHSV